MPTLKKMLKISEREFEILVNEGLEKIPERFLLLLENVAIVIQDEPNAEQLRKLKIENGYELFGLYEGVPKTKRGPSYGQVLPDKITVFKNPILRYASNFEEIKELVTQTVKHEIAHHLGSDEFGAKKAEKK